MHETDARSPELSAASGAGPTQPGIAAGAPTSTQQAGVSSAPAPEQSAGAQPVASGLPLARVQSRVGTNLAGAKGQNAGEIENPLVDRSGQVRAAVVEWSGFLDLDTRRAAVPIEQIQLDGAGGRARLNMSREELERLGSFDPADLGAYSKRQGWGEGSCMFGLAPFPPHACLLTVEGAGRGGTEWPEAVQTLPAALTV